MKLRALGLLISVEGGVGSFADASASASAIRSGKDRKGLLRRIAEEADLTAGDAPEQLATCCPRNLVRSRGSELGLRYRRPRQLLKHRPGPTFPRPT